MRLISAMRTGFTRFADFKGRSDRRDFWWWVLGALIVLFMTQFIDGAFIAPALGFLPFEGEAGQPLSLATSLLFLVPTLAYGVRRLHDNGKPGWWILAILVPVLGQLFLLYWFIKSGDKQANEFGPPAQKKS